MRNEFLLDPDLVYLNHGAFGACPRDVMAAQHHWQREMERNPVAFLDRRSAALLHEARADLAQALGGRTEELVFLPNTTTGINVVANSFPLAAGDEVLSTDLEYGSCEAVWQRACKRAGATYTRLSVPLPYHREAVVEQFRKAITPRTRLITVSHITSATALILPVAEICALARERGIATCIDGAHAPGQIPVNLDALAADFYVGNCHKWLCAPRGAAFLHARSEHHAMLDANVISWGYAEGIDQHAGSESFLGRTLFERRMQWQGTRDLSAWLAVPAALAFQQQHDWDSVRARCHALARMALDELTQRFGTQPIANDSDWAQMVAIPVPTQDPVALKQRLLDESRIEIPVTTHGGQTYLRVSVQGYNTAQDIEHLLLANALT